MRYFPQLETFTSGQYPLRRERHERVRHHDSLDGRRRSYYDGAAARVTWALRYQGLTDAERGAVDALFQECEGRLHDFVFLDPAANLLLWSEDYSQGAWTVDPMLVLQSGSDDPFGTARGTAAANTGAATQRIFQTIAAPGNMQYCFSAWVAGPGSCKLRIDSGGAIAEREFAPGGAWQRCFLSARPNSNATTVTFSLALDPGQTVKVAGMQAEAQIAPGGYRRTTTRSGLYQKARFSEDELTWIQQAPNNNAAEIRIESRP